jgi:transcriptional regulator with XRE-family HTH domain
MIVTYSESIPRELKAEMIRRDMSQHDLATRLGWRQQKLSRRLSGRVPLTVGDLELIASAMNSSLRIEFGFPLIASGRGAHR